MQRQRSPNATDVKIITPKGGDKLFGSDDVVVQWEMADKDSDALQAGVLIGPGKYARTAEPP